MRTEKEIVYSILNSLRGGHSSNNDMLSIRLIRSWIASERANLLLNFTDSGRSVSEENYQTLETKSFGKSHENVYKKELPKIIYFNRRSGIRLRYNDEVVLMCTKSQDRNYQKDMYLKSVPRAWTVGNTLYVRCSSGSTSSVNIDIDAVLFYPSDSSIYNWETDVYPLQSELITVLKETAISKEQNIINMSLNDTTNNFTSDNGTSR